MRHNHDVSPDVSPDASPDASARRGRDDALGTRRRGQDFPEAGWGRRGYDCAEVEDFLHEAERSLRHRPPAMAPYEVQDARFRGARWRQGYDMRAVDARLAELHTALREAHGEDSVSGVEGRESAREHRVAFWIYVVAAVLVVAILGAAGTQLLAQL